MTLPLRSAVLPENTWDLSPLYASWEAFYKDLEKAKKEVTSAPFFENEGKLEENIPLLKSTLDAYFSLQQFLSKLYVFSQLKHHEDVTEEKGKIAYSETTSLLHQYSSKSSWIIPEILSFKETFAEKIKESTELSLYRFFLEEVLRLKPHTLNDKEEKLLAQAGLALDATHRAFSALNDADLSFGVVLDSEKKEHPLTHGSYSLFLKSLDRTLRENAFFKMQEAYLSHENTIADLLGGTVQSHLFLANAKNYPSCLEAALFPKNISKKVYLSLIEAVSKHLPLHHRYIALRKKLLKVEELHFYDLYVPLTGNINKTISYEEAERLIVESLQPLGEEYLSVLKSGIQNRWVDKYENKGKRSGGYSSGCYESFPYILMNYKGDLRDLFTLAHELGHSMHSYFSNANQPYLYSDYSIFVAEVASTFNEALLSHYLLQKATTKEEKIFLIQGQIEDIRATLFRQTMFAEFELFIHSLAEQNIPLTPGTLKEKHLELNKKYFGEALSIDPELAIEWARIPHFYANFYVYQYATGISAALTLSEKVLNKEPNATENYLSFLKAGSSNYPLEVLKKAGVDMENTQAVEKAILYFGHLVDELEALMTDSP